MRARHDDTNLTDRLPAARWSRWTVGCAPRTPPTRWLIPRRAGTVRADFHRMPLPDDACGLSGGVLPVPSPSHGSVIAENHPLLLFSLLPAEPRSSRSRQRTVPGKRDQLVAGSRLDQQRPAVQACIRPPQGQTSPNWPRKPDRTAHHPETHSFTSRRSPDVAEYLATHQVRPAACPGTANPPPLATALSQRVPRCAGHGDLRLPIWSLSGHRSTDERGRS